MERVIERVDFQIPMQPKALRVCAYARVSSGKDAMLHSLSAQVSYYNSLIQSHADWLYCGVFSDEAITGTKSQRDGFQRMLASCRAGEIDLVITKSISRFARNTVTLLQTVRELKSLGVDVFFEEQNIHTMSADGELMLTILASYAQEESLSASENQKWRIRKAFENGELANLRFLFGYNITANGIQVNEKEAAIVREIYERYASGETKAEIIRDLKRRRVKTSLGKEFSPNSLSHLLSNKRYIGVYLYKGKETPGGMPRILDDDLFYRVQSMMNKNKNAQARTHGEGEYLLTTKLFCRHCKEMMVGYGGTSKTGRQYHYYMCKNARRKKCGKKIVSKSYIEDRVVNECLKMLTEEKIRFIAKKVAEECAKSPDNLTAKALKKAIREADTAIENLWKAIEQGQAVEMLTERLNKRIAEKAELEAELAIEENKKITLTEAQILAFLDYVCEMPADDVNKRRAIINIFVHSIYLYDDHFTLIINASKKPLSIDNIPLDDIETAFEGETGASEGCSSLSTPAPPKIKRHTKVCLFIFGGATSFGRRRP